MIKKHKRMPEHSHDLKNVSHDSNDEKQVKVNHKKHKNIFSPTVYFVSIALAIGCGFLLGGYRYQIKSIVGPIFGYNSYSSTLDLRSIEQTYNELAANYDGVVDTATLIEGANKGMVEAIGDTYTTYMSAQEASEYNDSLEGNIGGGIGAVISMKNDRVTILSVLDDNPAIEIGLQGGDAIIEINDESTSGMSVDIAVSKIRGEAGTTVKLLVDRAGEQITFNVTRAIINNPSVVSKIENGIGIIIISRFDESTGSLARTAAKSFVKENVSGVILDLRNNPGGYVDAAIDVAGLWLDNQTVVTERRGGKVIESLKSGTSPILNGIKTAVLVDGGSASASEIVAGALQDYGVAKIVGSQTYGKGSVQQLISLINGAQLKVTIAKWYTPNGKNITSEGVTPDYIVNLTQEDVDNDIDPQLNKAIEVL